MEIYNWIRSKKKLNPDVRDFFHLDLLQGGKGREENPDLIGAGSLLFSDKFSGDEILKDGGFVETKTTIYLNFLQKPDYDLFLI